MSRARWTPAETEHFAKLVFEEWLTNPFETVTTIGKRLAKQLPPENRRNITAISQTGQKDIYLAIKRLMNAKLKGEAPAVQAGTGDHEPEVIEVPVERLVQPDPARFMAAQPLEVLVLELLHRLTTPLAALERIEAILQRQFPQTASHITVVRAPQPVAMPLPRRVKKIIGICGVRREEFDEVVRKVEDRADLVFIDVNTYQTGIARPVHELVVLQLNSQSATEKAKAICGSSRTHFVSGPQNVLPKVFDLISRQ